MLVYVAGPYGKRSAITGNTEGQPENIARARKVAIELWEKGHAVICPHLNTAYMEQDCKVGWQDYLNGDYNMISRVDALVICEGWQDSKGTLTEIKYAESLAIPVYYYPEIPELHRTEIISPIQCQAFREITGRMYRTHLQKNADYSPANILLTGEPGLVTRLWDKTARLLNLTGFKFQALLCEGIEPPRNPKNESIDDTYMDMSVYAIIGLLLRQGKWGK
jgi:hypothetical protein